MQDIAAGRGKDGRSVVELNHVPGICCDKVCHAVTFRRPR